jgi:hypothetical protein
MNGFLRDHIMRHSKQNSCEHAGITARSAMGCKHMVQWSSSTSISGPRSKGSSVSTFGDVDSRLMRFGGGLDDGPGMRRVTVVMMTDLV